MFTFWCFILGLFLSATCLMGGFACGWLGYRNAAGILVGVGHIGAAVALSALNYEMGRRPVPYVASVVLVAVGIGFMIKRPDFRQKP